MASGLNTFMYSAAPGGAEGSRTPDLVIANDALYQLSYGPFSGIQASAGHRVAQGEVSTGLHKGAAASEPLASGRLCR